MFEVKDVRIDDSANRYRIKYSPRSLRINAGVSFNTPVRSITDRDYENNKNAPSSIKMVDLISNLTVYFDSETLRSFLNKNGALKILKNKVDNFMRPSVNSLVRVLSLRLEPRNVFQLLAHQSQVERFLRFICVAQNSMGTESLPYFISSGIDWRKLYSDFTRVHENPVVWIRMDENPKVFEKRVDYLCNLVSERQLRIIGVHYSDFFECNVNYDYFYQKMHDKEVLTMLEGVPRGIKRINDVVSGLHLYPFASFDSTSPYKMNRVQGGDDTIPHGKFLLKRNVTLRGLKEFNYQSEFRKYINSPIWTTLKKVAEFQSPLKIDDYGGRKLFRQFNSFSYAQQAKDGQEEMRKISGYIRKGEADEYLRGKRILRNTVEGTFPSPFF